MEFELIMTLIMLFVVLPLTFVGALYYRRWRRESYQRLAKELQFEYASNGDAFTDLTRDLLLFNRGVKQTIFDSALGESNQERLVILDYTYSTGYGKGSSSANQAVVLIESNETKLPSFQLYARQRYLEPNAAGIGMRPVEELGDRLFSSKYVLNATDESESAKLFHRELRQAILSGPLVYIECYAGTFAYHLYRLTKPSEMRALMNEAIKMRAQLIESASSGVSLSPA